MNEQNRFRCECVPGWQGSRCETGEFGRFDFNTIFGINVVIFVMAPYKSQIIIIVIKCIQISTNMPSIKLVSLQMTPEADDKIV